MVPGFFTIDEQDPRALGAGSNLPYYFRVCVLFLPDRLIPKKDSRSVAARE